MGIVKSDRHARVLVVEDDPMIRVTGADMLEDAGFNVVEAGSADEALEILEKNSDIQVLFSDVDMPGSMDGRELMTMVHERWPNIKLLLTSGHCRYANNELPDDGRFLSKPYSDKVVVRTINDILPDR